MFIAKLKSTNVQSGYQLRPQETLSFFSLIKDLFLFANCSIENIAQHRNLLQQRKQNFIKYFWSSKEIRSSKKKHFIIKDVQQTNQFDSLLSIKIQQKYYIIMNTSSKEACSSKSCNQKNLCLAKKFALAKNHLHNLCSAKKFN